MRKFRKVLIAFGLLFVCGLCFTPLAFAEGEEPTPTTTEEVEEVKTGTVIVDESIKGGIIVTDIKEGKVGDVVTITYEEAMLYTLDKIYVNGTQIQPNENGEYVFQIVEGENLITAHFAVDEQKVKDVSNLIDSFKSGDWRQLLTVENLLKLIYLAVTFVLSSGFILTYFRNKRFRAKTVADLQKTTKEEFTVVAKDILVETIKPLIETLLDTSKTQTERINAVVRALIALCDGSGETKLAVLNDLQKSLDDDDRKLIEVISSLVENKIQEKKDAEQKTIETLERIENDVTEEPQEENHL